MKEVTDPGVIYNNLCFKYNIMIDTLCEYYLSYKKGVRLISTINNNKQIINYSIDKLICFKY